MYQARKKVKGQAALEFLITYSWAFLTILITLAALYYFGVFNFSRFLPQQCLFSSQFECIDYALDGSADEVRFLLSNNIGEDLTVTEIILTYNGVECAPHVVSVSWVAGTQLAFTESVCNTGGFLTDERAEVFIALQYYADDTPVPVLEKLHWTRGKINANIN